MKKKKLEKKVFTKKKGKDIIKRNYNPLLVDCKLIYESEGLHMKKEKNSKKFLALLFKICSDFEVKDSRKEVEDFLSKNKISI